jgi:RadC-like JAB domain
VKYGELRFTCALLPSCSFTTTRAATLRRVQEDQEITRRLKETGEMLGIRVLDHVVLGDDGRFFSFSDRGLL